VALLGPALNNDIRAIEQATAPQTPAMNLALAQFLVKQGKTEDAMKHFRAAGTSSKEDRRALLEELLARRDFEAAYEVWSSDSSERRIAGEFFVNGGFEEAILRGQFGFDWQFAAASPTVKAVLDGEELRHGANSMRIDWNGNSDPNVVTASQLILVSAKTRYRLSFAARARDLSTLGLPIVSVVDPGETVETVIGQPVSLPSGSTDWQTYSADFVTGDHTRAIRISIARANCKSQSCPAFGSAWFDDFSMIKID
jgi:hypothetical protein